MTNARPLVLSSEVHQHLALYRSRPGARAAAPLDLDAIEEVERSLDLTLPDDVLAFLSATGRDVFQVVTFTEEARETTGLTKTYVAFSCDEKEQLWFSIERRRASREQPSTVVVFPFEGVRQRPETVPMIVFLRWRLPIDDLPDDLVAKPFAPEVRARKHGNGSRKVVHGKFGEGVVLREINDGSHKLEVDFAGLGRKTVLASFVRDA